MKTSKVAALLTAAHMRSLITGYALKSNNTGDFISGICYTAGGYESYSLPDGAVSIKDIARKVLSSAVMGRG